MKKLKVLAMNISKKDKMFRKLARKIMYIYRRSTYLITSIGKKVDEKTIVFSCFNGKSYADSPKAIYEYMLNHEEYKDYNYIWLFGHDCIEKYNFLNNKSFLK